jgi:hypothetical protein
LPWQKHQFIVIRYKEGAKEKQIKRQHDEKYLGKNSFADKLCWSFDEFIQKVKHDFGFLPCPHNGYLN